MRANLGGKMGAPVLKYNQEGLIPAVVQDVHTREVLMVAYMNGEAVERTLSSGEAWFWSRSRGQLWHKGETSGSFLYVRSVITDCDSDTLLLLVEPAGPVCHTGARSCFFEQIFPNR